MTSKILPIVLSVLSMGSVQAALISINSTGTDSVTWVTGNASFLNAQFNITGNPAGLFSNTAFTVFYYPDDRATQGLRTFGALMPSGVEFTNSFHRGGATVDLTAATFGNSLWFLDTGVLQNQAVNGTDNYVGIRKMDTSSQYHYGWMQFELNQFSNGITAVDFIGGSVDSVANVSSQAGALAVPEPSALLLGVVGTLGMFRRRRI